MIIEHAMQEYITLFSMFPDWFAKYEYLTSVASAMESFPEEQKTSNNLMKGCQTQTWVYADRTSGHSAPHWYADSDSMMIKGILGIILDIIDHQEADEIQKVDMDFLKKAGISENLEVNRNTGMQSIFRHIHAIAREIEQAAI